MGLCLAEQLFALLGKVLGHLGVDLLEHPFNRYRSGRLGLPDRSGQLLVDLVPGCLFFVVRPQLTAYQEATETLDAVTAAPRLHFLARAVTGVVVGRRVPAVAVDDELDERRPHALARALHHLAGDVVRRQHVHPIDEVAGHAVGVRLHGDVVRPGLALEVDADGVTVVLAGEHNGRALSAGQVDASVPVTLAGSAVTEADQRDLRAVT